MPRTVTINTVQGIGDIFWVYQKLAPYFDIINITVFCVGLTAVQTRAKTFCKMLPKVGAVEYRQVPDAVYHQLARTRFKLADVLASNGAVNYAVNAPLEIGIKLRDIDPGSQIEEFVDLGLSSQIQRTDHLCVFVAGASGNAVWTTQQWLVAIKKFAERLQTRNIDLIGAEWDKAAQAAILAGLGGYHVTNHVGRSEERRVGKECRSRRDWSSDVCSSDLIADEEHRSYRSRVGQGGAGCDSGRARRLSRNQSRWRTRACRKRERDQKLAVLYRVSIGAQRDRGQLRRSAIDALFQETGAHAVHVVQAFQHQNKIFCRDVCR